VLLKSVRFWWAVLALAIKNLCAICDDYSNGHVIVRPRDMSQMQKWINSKGTDGPPHPLTEEVRSALIGEKKK
jgi:hypothetical protein